MFKIKRLETDRLILRRYKKADLIDYIEWRSQEDYHTYLPTKPKTKSEYKESLYSNIKNYDDDTQPNLTWAMELKAEKKLIGSIMLSKISSYHRSCELGWGLNMKYQKHGYAYEGAKRVIDFLFGVFDMNKISVSIWEGNVASINLAIRLGFVSEGVERQARIKDGKYYDVYHYGLLKSEYKR